MIKKNLFYNSLLSISQFIFPLITFPYSSRILGPKGIGAVNFIDSFTQYFILFAALGIPTYGVREISKRKNDIVALNNTFSEIFVVHISSAAIFSIIYLTAAFLVPALHVHLDLVCIGIIILFFGVLQAEWLFQGIEEFGYITLRSLVVRCVTVIILFGFLRGDSEPWVYYAIGGSGYVINGLLNVYFLRKHVKLTVVNLNLKVHVKPLLIILGSSLAVSVYLLMDTIILGFIKGDLAVGIYTTALRVAKIPFAVIGAISSVMIPQISQAFHKEDYQQIKTLIHKSFSFVCVVGIPFVFGLLVTAPFLIDSFAGKKFDSAILILQILSPLVLIVGISNIYALQLLTTMGREKLLLKTVIIGMFVSLIGNIILIPILSYKGAAITNILTEIVVTFMAYYFVRKYIKIPLDGKIFFQCFFGAAVFIPIAYLVKYISIGQLYQDLLTIIICATFYVAFIYFFVKNIYVNNFKELVFEKLGFKNHVQSTFK